MRQEGWLPKGLHFHGKHELIAALRSWLAVPGASTIGDTSSFHGQFWISADIGSHRVRVAADTTREAAQRIVDYASSDPARPWHVVANQKGRINKVVVTDRLEPGWYAYIAPPLEAETTI